PSELGCAAADVDVEYRLVVPARAGNATGAMRRQRRLESVTRGRADELTAFGREQVRELARVVSFQRGPGQDDGARVDVLAREPGGCVPPGDVRLERGRIDGVPGRVRRHDDGGAMQHVALDDDEAARQ